jgi:DNA-binding NarL/FixJ family response regulator
MKVLLVDEHTLVRQGFAMLLSDFQSDMEIIEARGAEQAIELCEAKGTFDLVLLDLMMEGMNGLEVLDVLGERLPGVPIVIISASESRVTILAAFQRGAKGYIVKSSTAETFKLALRLVLLGEHYVPPHVMGSGQGPSLGALDHSVSQTAGGARCKGLTPRQREVLALLAEGQPNKEIARNLGMLAGTAKVHVRAIFRKLEVNNRTTAVFVGIRLGYIPRMS